MNFNYKTIFALILTCLGNIHLLATIRYVGSDKEFTLIQDAIDASRSGDVVIVDPGIYLEIIDFLGKDITVSSTDPDSPSVVENTVIDAGGNGSAVSFMNSENSEAIITGFTITGGYGTNLEGNSNTVVGGGIVCIGASPTIRNNIITGNHGPLDENTFVGIGAGIACLNSDAIITRNVIKNNTTYGAAAIYVATCSPVITNNLIYNNSATYIGGVYLAYGGYLFNNTFVDNSASALGGSICGFGDEDAGRFVIENNIVCYSKGGGIHIEGGPIDYGAVRFNNLWNNTGGNYDNLPDQTGINGNISVNPGFIDDAYHISFSSPCYEAGNPAYAPYLWQRDIDGEAAVMDSRPDIGADEVTGNARPVADAGPDQFFDAIPAEVVLDGSGSFDLDPADTLTYEWTQIAGPAITLAGNDTVSPTFIPPTEAIYLFELTVSDGILTSYADAMMIVVGNREPVANAGVDISGEPGETIVLNGYNSYDPDAEDELTYIWTQISGVSVDLTDDNTAGPSFVAPGEGEYVFQLIVDDGADQSQPDTITVTIRVGSEYDAYGYQWIDSDSTWGPRYYWQDIQQTGTEISGLAYTFEDFVGPFPIGFNFNFYGSDYQQFYVQSNGVINFNSVVIPYDNQPIPAEDGYNGLIAWMWTYMYPDDNSKAYYQQFEGFTVIQFVDYVIGWDGVVNAEVILYESGKIIVQYKNFSEDAYTYIQTIGIENANGAIGTQVAYNQYGYLHDELAIEFSFGPPHQPVAMAGPDQHLLEIQPVTLDGSQSYDRDFSDVLTYQWTQLSGPPVELSDPTAIQPTFMPEIEAEYSFQLIINDGVLTSYPDEVLIVVGNRAPVANAGTDKPIQVGTRVRLDGSGSYDPDPGTTLSYSWIQIEGPTVELQESETATPYFDCVEDGIYIFELVVSDGHKQSKPDTVEMVTVDMTVNLQELALQNLGTYAHYGDVSGDKVVYGVGNACDYTWRFRYINLTTGAATTFQGPHMQPKIDGDLVVWMKYGNGFGNPWQHEPCNSSVFVRNLATGSQKTLRHWTWSDSYGHPVVSGNKVIWMEHHNLDPKPTRSSEANNWWNTPFSICGADISDWNNPVFFTVDENVGRHDPYPCHTYSSDFDDVVDICDDIVVWEADGDIYGADVSNLANIQIFPICLYPGRQYDPAISGNQVVWTDERNDNGDIYGADISNQYNINVFELVKASGRQQQAAIDGSLVIYVDGSSNNEQIKFCCLTKRHGLIEIPLEKNYYGIGPAIDKDCVVWQSDTYGEARGISLKVSYSIADGSVKNITQTKQYDYIQYAINEAVSGDEIVVHPGVYEENINLNGKNLILRSSEPTNATIVETTVLQGLGNGSAVTFDGTEDVSCILNGFTISGGATIERGGGIAGNGTHAGISNCRIRDNAAAYGGGIDQCHGRIEKCIVANNSASVNGGGFAVCGGTITNCLVYGNSAGNYGGGLHYCNGTVNNCTIVDNTASLGGGMNNCSGSISNCIVWDNTPVDVLSISSPTYCCSPGLVGEGNIDADPLFVDPNNGDFRLLSESPCIDAGDSAYVPQENETDIDGWPRSIGSAVDLGGYEWDGERARICAWPKKIHLYVSDPNLTAEKSLYIMNSGASTLTWQIIENCSWLNMTPSSGDSINKINEVCISVDANGLLEDVYKYTANISSDNATNPNQPFEIVLHVNRTILNVPTEYKYIQHAIDLSEDWDTIRVLPGTYSENIDFCGKNITVTSTNPDDSSTIASTVIQGLGNDGVVTFDGSENENCALLGFTITGGINAERGGGVTGNGTHAGIYRCTIENNLANFGGGIDQCHGRIEQCIIRNNSAMLNGGGLAVCGGVITNCLVYGNSAGGYGGGLHYCNGTINNCTIADNTASLGGGLNNCSGSISNCIVWHNTPVDVLSISSPTYCCSPGLVGEGNIDADPLFMNLASGDYHLRPDSPCVDAGADLGLYDDIEGNPRPFNVLGIDNKGGLVGYDMGAYELVYPTVELPMRFTPNTLNCNSNGNWIKAHFILPEQYGLEDVNTDIPAYLEPFGVESKYINSSVDKQGRIEIEIAFDRSGLCDSVMQNGPIEISVTGALKTGEYYYGTDTINLTVDNLKQIATFASQWLQTGVGLDADLNKDACVDLTDFSILARNINAQ